MGLQDGDGEDFKRDEVRWIAPDGRKPDEAGKPGISGSEFSLPKLEDTAEALTASEARAIGASITKPFYTVPANSTLMGSVAMTALIGRVLVDGTVNDPYPYITKNPLLAPYVVKITKILPCCQRWTC